MDDDRLGLGPRTAADDETLEDVQRRLDGYRTNKQRRKRLNELERLRSPGGFSPMPRMAEMGVLIMRLARPPVIVTVQEAAAELMRGVRTGSIRAKVGDIALPRAH